MGPTVRFTAVGSYDKAQFTVQLLRGLLDVPVFVPVAPHVGGLPIGAAWYSQHRSPNVTHSALPVHTCCLAS